MDRLPYARGLSCASDSTEHVLSHLTPEALQERVPYLLPLPGGQANRADKCLLS